MRYLSFIQNDTVVQQIELPTGLDTETVIDLDSFLRKAGLLKNDQEIAVTEDIICNLL